MKHKKPKPPVSRLIIDEAVSREAVDRFRKFAKGKNCWSDEHLRIKDRHPGMPDGEILHHLLDKTTVFLTTDRPMHNTVLSKGLRSWYVSQDGEFRGNFLKGIAAVPDSKLQVRTEEARESYHQDQPAIRPAVMPEHEGRLKKLRVKRRRIRAHFGGQDNMGAASVTLSVRDLGPKALIGIRLKVSGRVQGVKGLDASESYVEETIPPEHRDAAAHCHALIVILQLMLHELEVQVYYDTERMSKASPLPVQDGSGGYDPFLSELQACVPSIEYIPTVKGPFIERMRRKLDDLARKRTNEIMPGGLDEMRNRWLCGNAQDTDEDGQLEEIPF